MLPLEEFYYQLHKHIRKHFFSRAVLLIFPLEYNENKGIRNVYLQYLGNHFIFMATKCDLDENWLIEHIWFNQNWLKQTRLCFEHI